MYRFDWVRHHRLGRFLTDIQLFPQGISSSLKLPAENLLSQRMFFFAYTNSVFPKLCAEDFFDHQDCAKGIDIRLVEEPLKTPAYPLPCHPKGLVNLLTVCTFKNHSAGPIRLQFYPQILRIHQLLQFRQEYRIFLCQHVFSPLYPAHPARYLQHRHELRI